MVRKHIASLSQNINKIHIRIVLVLLILVLSTPVVAKAITNPTDIPRTSTNIHNPDAIHSASNLTVVTSHLGDDRNGSIAVINNSGDIVYQNSTYTRYFDVDPVADTQYTVLYVAEENVPSEECGISDSDIVCIQQIFERVNISTGETTRLYSDTIITTRTDSWHDIDRLDEHRYIVADIFNDRVFIMNTSTGIITWEWQASNTFPIDSGGSTKTDWTHVNDVEVVQNGTIMLSLRNHDQVVFIDRRDGVQSNWTIGSDGEHETLYEQHNPDYIPEDRGGPAVVIADSENNRIIEYQRQNGTWVQSWIWQDSQMEWPRDADRLPNGNTLITDTHSNRLIEINESGNIIWQTTYPRPYEAERLGTGDESSGGESAERIGITNRSPQPTTSESSNVNIIGEIKRTAINLVPNKIRHGILWVLPPWVTFADVLLISVATFSVIVLVVLELYLWSKNRVGVQMPIKLKNR